ncbi:hypothetical protein DGM98_20260 [Xanthomonas citri]|uniref:Secreted protein n=1 Tax=Xanthomonas citri pv. phaseoli var. fuscans TaxID=473423 RepID=A0AB33F9U4_XANCI|nr:hypothetical protein DGM98_20260 [Xanthomonas citri]
MLVLVLVLARLPARRPMPALSGRGKSAADFDTMPCIHAGCSRVASTRLASGQPIASSTGSISDEERVA